MSAPVLAPILLMAFTPGALRTSLVIAVVRIALALAALPSPAAFAPAVQLATEALLRNLRAWPKTGPAGCTPPVPHGYTPPDGSTSSSDGCAHNRLKINPLHDGAASDSPSGCPRLQRVLPETQSDAKRQKLRGPPTAVIIHRKLDRHRRRIPVRLSRHTDRSGSENHPRVRKNEHRWVKSNERQGL
jgi:hypothetical protein